MIYIVPIVCSLLALYGVLDERVAVALIYGFLLTSFLKEVNKTKGG